MYSDSRILPSVALVLRHDLRVETHELERILRRVFRVARSQHYLAVAGGCAAKISRNGKRAPTRYREVVPTSCNLAGNSTMNFVPSPGMLDIVIVPSCTATIHDTIDSPRPAPPCSRERALSTL